MRGILIVAVLVGLGYLFVRQKHHEPGTTTDNTVSAAAIAGTPALTPAPRGQASKYNYAKRAIDRARDVKEQSQARTQADQNP